MLWQNASTKRFLGLKSLTMRYYGPAGADSVESAR